MALFILDFDETIASENTHNAVSHLTKMDDMWEVIKEIQPIGGPDVWRTTLCDILDKGHSLAIASFNAYGGSFIPKYLREIIKLDEDKIQAIHVESWLPYNPTEANKNAHIGFIIKDTGYTGASDTIVLVDDDLKNIIAASEKKYKTIHASGKYIDHIQKLSNDWNYSVSSTHKLGIFASKKLQDDDEASPDSCCVIM